MPVKGKLMHSWVKRVTVLIQAGDGLSHVAGDTNHVRQLGTSAHFRVEVSVATGSGEGDSLPNPSLAASLHVHRVGVIGL